MTPKQMHKRLYSIHRDYWMYRLNYANYLSEFTEGDPMLAQFIAENDVVIAAVVEEYMSGKMDDGYYYHNEDLAERMRHREEIPGLASPRYFGQKNKQMLRLKLP